MLAWLCLPVKKRSPGGVGIQLSWLISSFAGCGQRVGQIDSMAMCTAGTSTDRQQGMLNNCCEQLMPQGSGGVA